jgi:AraC-like DNA-binding protein
MGNVEKEKIQFNSPSSISITEEDGPEKYPLHWHNAAEFTLVLKDGCQYRVNDTFYELSAGDVLFVWPHQIHETIHSPHGSAIFIQFPSDIIENNLDLVYISRFLFAFKHLSAKDNPELSTYVSDKFFEIKKIHNSTDPLSETKCKMCIYDILLSVGEYVIAERKRDMGSLGDSGSGWPYIRAACRFIVENSSDDLTQADVADHVGLSTFYFSKLFKQYMHMSFPTYLSNIRVKRAATLLIEEDMSITECAFLSGFQSTTTFNKAFFSITGYSPREYRKLHR